MIKTAIKLLIAVAMINAAARAGMAALKYYQLKDGAQEVVLFGGTVSTDELRSEILDKAARLGVPLDLEGIDVRRDGSRTVASVSYVQPIDLLPTFTYPLDLSFSVEAFRAVGLR